MWGEIWNAQLELDDEAYRVLSDIIEHAATQAALDGGTPSRIAEAEENLRRFVVTIQAELRDESRAKGSRRVTVQSIETVKAGVCPIYPIC